MPRLNALFYVCGKVKTAEFLTPESAKINNSVMVKGKTGLPNFRRNCQLFGSK
jgi:hypothetical protein